VSIKPLITLGHYRAACVLLAENAFAPDATRARLKLEQEELVRHIAQDSAARLSLHALDAGEVTRLLGVAPRQEARYGEEYILLRVTLDASQSRVPVELTGISLHAVDDRIAWVTDHRDGEKVAAAHLELLGAKHSVARGGGSGGGFGPDFSLDTFKPLGPLAFHGFALFHLFTGGLVLLSNATRSAPADSLYLSPVLRQRDRNPSRLHWSPPSRPPAPVSPQQAVERLRELEGIDSGCRAEPGEQCRTYKLVMRRDPKDWIKSSGELSGQVVFHIEPACQLQIYTELPLPSAPTLGERLRAFEAAGPRVVALPPAHEKSAVEATP
jgi:hypothetical protein